MIHAAADILALLKRVYATGNSYFDEQRNYCHRIPDTFTAAERQALADAGLLPNTFVSMPHDEAIARLQSAAAAVDLQRAAGAFVASLGSAGLQWLTVLPATALGLAMPAHTALPMSSHATGITCRICFHSDGSEDRTMRSYFRQLQGAGWGSSEGPLAGVLALEDSLGSDSAAWPQPTDRDIWVFHQVLDLLRGLPPDARYSKARSALKDAKLLASNNQYRCETLLEALALIGVMATAERPGMFTQFTSAVDRDQRPNTRVEVPGPLAWWRSSDGLNEALVTRLFGHLRRPASEPVALKAVKAARPKTAAPPARPKAVGGPVAAGDVYAVRYREDLWGAAYCHEVCTDARGITRGRMEYLDIVSPTPPTAEQVQRLNFRDRTDGKRWEGWFAGLDKTPGVKRIAAQVAAPAHDQPVPERIPFGQAKELTHLASWNFPELQEKGFG
ncbi:hypothetical protein [Rhizobacter sp. Root1221]|uniref:hypothetical protein n=1 Tax=Rhizobacter sp. Root1221 TaxID=1736433 RepID=UPI00070035F1|nr:hypothetical protein [Rhizobacter sp. Root1221]KQV99629.1 hypothetical protein ASC87_02705 [Rhizobacter sp. Root1221]